LLKREEDPTLPNVI